MGANKASICKLLNDFEKMLFEGKDAKSFKDLCAKAVEDEGDRFHRERFAQLTLVLKYIEVPKSYQYTAAVEIYKGLMANHSYARKQSCNCPLIKKEENLKSQHHPDSLHYLAGGF